MTIPRLSQRAISKIRARLRAASPNCHWCGHATIPAIPAPFHPDMATVDHLKARWQCVSAEEYHAATNLVLACMECNQERDRVEVALLAHRKEELARVERLRVPQRRVLVRTARYLSR